MSAFFAPVAPRPPPNLGEGSFGFWHDSFQPAVFPTQSESSCNQQDHGLFDRYGNSDHQQSYHDIRQDFEPSTWSNTQEGHYNINNQLRDQPEARAVWQHNPQILWAPQVYGHDGSQTSTHDLSTDQSLAIPTTTGYGLVPEYALDSSLASSNYHSISTSPSYTISSDNSASSSQRSYQGYLFSQYALPEYGSNQDSDNQEVSMDEISHKDMYHRQCMYLSTSPNPYGQMATTPESLDGAISPSSYRSTRKSMTVQSVGKQRQHQILIEGRRRGLSYRDIKEQYGFEEAESTLRGRYRTLTKDKNRRIRKPEWRDRDCLLLREAVLSRVGERKLKNVTTAEHVDSLNAPWKEISKYIVEHGGSYAFGYATCKKKYTELCLQAQHKKNVARVSHAEAPASRPDQINSRIDSNHVPNFLNFSGVSNKD